MVAVATDIGRIKWPIRLAGEVGDRRRIFPAHLLAENVELALSIYRVPRHDLA